MKGKTPAGLITGLLTYLLIFLPAALGFFYVWRFGVDVPVNDTWTLVPLFDKLSSGTLGVADLWAQHYEHRMFFPRIAILLVGTLAAFNNVAIMYFTEVCFLATLIILLLAFRRTVRANLLFFLPIPFLVFSWGQFWNMFQAFQLTFVFPQVFSVLTFYLLYLWGYGRYKKPAFAGAVGSATVASFSSAHGLLVWPIGFLQLLIMPARRRTKTLLTGAWALLGVAEWMVYFLVAYAKPTVEAASQGNLFDNPNPVVDYYLAVLGGSLFRQPTLALVVGFLLACLIAVSLFSVYRNGKLGESSFWIAILFFSLAVMAAFTVGRSGIDLIGGGTQLSKYVTFSILATIAAYAMLVKSAFEQRTRPTIFSLAAISVLIVASIPVMYVQGFQTGKGQEQRRKEAAFVVATYESQPDAFIKNYGNPRPIKRGSSTLKRLDYSIFSHPRQSGILPPELSGLSSVSSSTGSSIGSINGTRVNSQDQPVVIPEGKPFVRVNGWAVDARAKKSAGGVYVDVDGKLFPALYGNSTRSLVNRFDVSAYQNSGFVRTIPMSEIGPGKHELSLVVVTSDREGYYRPDQTVTFEVR